MTKRITPEEVCFVPEELVEEGQQRKLQKVSKYNEVTVYESGGSSDDDFDTTNHTFPHIIKDLFMGIPWKLMFMLFILAI